MKSQKTTKLFQIILVTGIALSMTACSYSETSQQVDLSIQHPQKTSAQVAAVNDNKLVPEPTQAVTKPDGTVSIYVVSSSEDSCVYNICFLQEQMLKARERYQQLGERGDQRALFYLMNTEEALRCTNESQAMRSIADPVLLREAVNNLNRAILRLNQLQSQNKSTEGK